MAGERGELPCSIAAPFTLAKAAPLTATSLCRSKLTTLVTSLFTSAYVFHWPQFFPNSPLSLEQLPVFDGRSVTPPL
jgi:hypothetical protein